MNKRTILIICLVIYFIIVFSTEILYRQKLYELSLEYIEKIEQRGFFHYFYYFWAIIFPICLIIIVIVFPLLFFPINTAFSYISIQHTLGFILCLLKSLYSEARPFLDIYLKKEKDTSLTSPTECDRGYGNPSGHALSSIHLLCLWDLFLCSHFFNKIEGKKKYLIKYLTLFLSIISIIFICYSRINRQVHSFNQIIFGSIIGVGFYFIYFNILDINKISTDIFITYLDKAKLILIPLIIILFGISVTLGLTRHNVKEKGYILILLKYCNYDPNQILGRHSALNSSKIFIVIGGYIGLLYLKNKIEKNNQNISNLFYNWNQGYKFITFKITLFSFALPAIFPTMAIKLVSYDYLILKIILHSLTFFIYGFLSFGLCFYYGCIWFKQKEMSLETNILTIS